MEKATDTAIVAPQTTSEYPILRPPSTPDLTGVVKRSEDKFPSHLGGYADVYIGYLWGNPTWEVAVKVLRTENDPYTLDCIEKRLCREVAIWHKLVHKNILRFLGLAYDLGRHKQCPALISPYCRQGTVHDYLHNSNPAIEERVRLILGVAQGLEYLHEEGIIHGDLTPWNVLVSDNNEPLLCDFGRSCIIDVHGFTTRPAGLARYQAPELVLGAVSATNKNTDVYAFGLTAFTIWTDIMPFSEIYVDTVIILRHIRGDVQLQLPYPRPVMTEHLWPMLFLCSDVIPEKRPVVQELVRKLETCLQQLPLPETVIDRSSQRFQEELSPLPLTISDDGRTTDLQRLPTESSANLYSECRNIMAEVAEKVAKKNLAVDLKGAKAQAIVDVLSKVLYEQDTPHSQRERKYILHFLAKIAKSAYVFPKAFELEGVECDLTQHITEGGFGYIYKGEHDGQPVCVKTLRVAERHNNYRQRLRAQASELITWAHLTHKNILPFRGLYFSNEGIPRVCIVSPWMENGDLLQFLSIHPNTPRIPLLHDIISGLHYLHNLDIVHGDLKGKNILVSGTKQAVLADFGLSRMSMTLTTTTANLGGGTANWMAPELLLDDAEPTPKKQSDIWAFGCTCYEVLSGKMPFYQFGNIAQLIRAFMKGGIVPLRPESELNTRLDENEQVWPLAEQCWKYDPTHRPKSDTLLCAFTELNTMDSCPSNDQTHAMTKRAEINIDYSYVHEVLQMIEQSPLRNRENERKASEHRME